MAGTPRGRRPHPSDRPANYTGPSSSWIRTLIKLPRNRPVHVLMYSRYSTDEQDMSSVAAQIAFCKRFLNELGLSDVTVETISDEELSGELRHRPGIDRVWEGIEEHRWDLILCEDSSRLYRNELFAFDLVGFAVDQGVRVIFIADQIDTADGQWPDRLHDVMKLYARVPEYTSRKIKSKHDWLWRIGAAIGPLRTGYKRERRLVPPVEGEERATGVEASFDAIDEQWAPFVRQAFERIAHSEPPWKVAEHLSRNKVPKTSNAHSPDWAERDVISLIRCSTYRGMEVFRTTVSQRSFRKGGRRPKRNPRSARLYRDSPHLQIVSEALWEGANAAIAARCRTPARENDESHPLRGIPRDARGPLSRLFQCGVCNTSMHRGGGRLGKGYACGAASKHECWNHSTCLIELTHQKIFEEVAGRLQGIDNDVDRFVEHVRTLAGPSERRAERLSLLRKNGAQIQRQLARLCDRVEQLKDVPLSLYDRIKGRERELREIRKQMHLLKRIDEQLAAITAPRLLSRVQALLEQMQEMDRHAGVALRQIVHRVSAIPCQQFGGRKVVLRARVEIDLARLLSQEVRPTLELLEACEEAPPLSPIVLMVDLFEPTGVPQHASAALILRRKGLTLMAIAKKLGITKRVAHLAVQYGEELEQAGVTDPFVELTECPENASRWRFCPSPQDETGSPSNRPSR